MVSGVSIFSICPFCYSLFRFNQLITPVLLQVMLMVFDIVSIKVLIVKLPMAFAPEAYAVAFSKEQKIEFVLVV